MSCILDFSILSFSRLYKLDILIFGHHHSFMPHFDWKPYFLHEIMYKFKYNVLIEYHDLSGNEIYLRQTKSAKLH